MDQKRQDPEEDVVIDLDGEDSRSSGAVVKAADVATAIEVRHQAGLPNREEGISNKGIGGAQTPPVECGATFW
ncbi:hypothetical protein NDU88_003370 [Pleurodeles waltl]|uniref:Uncharacterized protein n=1 Tax=Pleurodeles waltl TaxID=8319 RepID=A0AAV7UBV4_PLEWA|nr:hypothetical protein NDU88_003370 [Pleurodeles waltl]